MAERADLRISQRLPIVSVAAALLAIVMAFSVAQRLREIEDRYQKVDFMLFYGWWTDYSGGGDPWVVSTAPRDARPGIPRPRYCNYTPFFVEVFAPLARLDEKAAFWLWETAQILSLVGAVLMLARGNDPPLGTSATIIVLSLVLMSRQFAGAIVYSQITPMMLGLMCASWFFERRGRPAVAGLCLALAALIKLFPAAAAGYFLFGRRWRALGWTVCFFVAAVILTNPARWIEMATLEIPVSYHVVGRAELTVLAFARSLVAHFSGTTTFKAPFFPVMAITALIDLVLLAIAAAASIAGRDRSDLDGLVFGLWVALALLMSPLAWIPETLLLLPAYLFATLAAWDGFQQRGAGRQILLIAGSAILAGCIVTALIKAVHHPGFAVLIAAYLGAALIFRARTQSDSTRDEARQVAS